MPGKRQRHGAASLFCRVFFSCLFLLAVPAHAEIVGLDASWQVNEIGRDSEENNLSSFHQRYHLQWNPRITRAIFLDTNMDYSRNWTSGSGYREIISPMADLQVRNDLFTAELNGLVTRTNNSEARDQDSHSWEAVLSSNWDYLYWPSLSLLFGNNRITDGEVVHVTDNDRSWSEFVAQWAAHDVELYYSYYLQNRTDYAEQSSTDERTHFGRLDYNRAFFGNRVQLGFSQQVTRSTTEFDAHVGEGGAAKVAVGLSRAMAGIDNTPDQGTLPANPALIDGNRQDRAFVIGLHEVANIAVKTDFQVVDLLYVYTTVLDPLLVGDATSLRWDLYSSDDGLQWHREVVNPATTYNRDENRYEVNTGGLQSIYLKLVVTGWPPALSIPVTEIVAYRLQSGSGGRVNDYQHYTKYVSDLNLRYDPTRNTRLTYSLVWDNSDYNTGNDRHRLFQTGSIRWLYNRYFIPTFTINDTTTTNSELVDTIQRSYALVIQSTPVPTLESSLGITRNENYEDDELINTNHTINFLNSATLYPNLETTLDLSVIFNNNREYDTTNQAMSVRWTLTGRLRSTLIADLIAEYGTNTLDFAELINNEDAGGRTTLNINWRPSDLVSVLVNGSQGYGDKWINYRSFLLDAKFSVVRTAKTQVILGYRANATHDETIQNFSYNWSWNISSYLTLQSIASYMLTEEENIWAVNARLTARF